MEIFYLEKTVFYERIDGRGEGLPIFFIQTHVYEAPKEDSSFGEYRETIQHDVIKITSMIRYDSYESC